MIIAHAPSGYILATLLIKRMARAPVTVKAIIITGIIGALAPDFDMVYFYLFDNKQTHHHKYFSHWPIIWLGLTTLSAIWFNYAKQSKSATLSLIFCLGGVLHVILDSFVGDIWWFAPFLDKPYSLFTVPAKFKPWWLNFILHWSFAVELIICFWAFLIYRRRCSKHPLQAPPQQTTIRAETLDK